MRLNRRVPNGTHGGVRGRGLLSPSYSIDLGAVVCGVKAVDEMVQTIELAAVTVYFLHYLCAALAEKSQLVLPLALEMLFKIMPAQLFVAACVYKGLPDFSDFRLHTRRPLLFE